MNPLHLFPTAGFDRSTTTPVLLGVLISWCFTETFGWVFAGLVVPGYLAAVFAIDPRAGMVDVAEAIFTYGLSRAIGEHLPRTGLTSRVFGRERFLLIVLSSIVVRLAVEGALLPRFAPHAAGSFFSIGLVVVPLAANACWKTGLAKGLVQSGVPTLLVYLLLKLVLLPHTNLSLAGFELATEDVASSFLDSPKAYILLITGAILAAAANVLDGWDFNGILVPALLSLVVLEPVKLGATFIEAVVIVMIAAALLKSTRLGRANVEGPRRLVLFFSIDYAARFVFASIVGRSLPGADVVGLMGFGYLLPTLLAVKIAQRGSAPLVLLPTAQVSVGAFALGTLIGFSAAMVDTAPSAARAAITRPLGRAPLDPEAAALWVGALARTTPHEGKGPKPVAATEVVGQVDRAAASDEHAAGPLELQRLERGVFLLREPFQSLEDRFGDPAVLATASGRAAGRRVTLVVDRPVGAPETAALAGRLVAEGRVDAAVIAGQQGDDTAPFARATLEVARALSARGDTPGAVIALRRAEGAQGRVSVRGDGGSAARVDALVLALERATGPLPRAAGPAQGPDVVIELPESAIAKLFAGDPKATPPSIASPAALATVLDDVRATTATASLEDLLALRRLVLEPLFTPSTAPRPHLVTLVRASAGKLGYELLGPSPLADGGEAFVLRPAAPRPFAAVVRTTGVTGTIVEVPHGFHDRMRDAAIRVTLGLGADALLLGLEHGGGSRGGNALRLAHAVASAEVAGRVANIVLLYEGIDERTAPGVVSIGAWGGVGREPLAALTRSTLSALGVQTIEGPLDLGPRELGARALFGETPLVAATLDRAALHALSLDESRFSARSLTTPALPALLTHDGALVDAASKLAAAIPEGLPAPNVDVLDLARRSTMEQSIVARRSLAAVLSSSAARAGIVHGRQGDFLVLVARNDKGWIAAALPFDPRAPSFDPRAPRDSKVTEAKTLRDCAAVLDAAGVCRAAAP
ncbi:MAG: poly-gamma-glutamate biosynthesis protein PgsC/CapC [Deltaproteobacteria bacterium]|nr:poly-gamma-glutamate biosynthesis protein PgsC/CapC [Deltaproteobacteria bacterium]